MARELMVSSSVNAIDDCAMRYLAIGRRDKISRQHGWSRTGSIERIARETVALGPPVGVTS